jgi:hypothetical protein
MPLITLFMAHFTSMSDLVVFKDDRTEGLMLLRRTEAEKGGFEVVNKSAADRASTHGPRRSQKTF